MIFMRVFAAAVTAHAGTMARRVAGVFIILRIASPSLETPLYDAVGAAL
jgi:hypothetical protein